MIFTWKNTFLCFLCAVYGLALVKSTCIRDEQGNIVEKPQSGGFGLGILHSVGCSIEKGVQRIGDGAKSIRGEVREVLKSGINILTQPFHSHKGDNNHLNTNHQQPDKNYQNGANYQNGGNNQYNPYNQPDPNYQTNSNNRPNNNYGSNNHYQANNNGQPQGNGRIIPPESSTLPYESLIDVRAGEIFNMGTEYLQLEPTSERPSTVAKDPSSVDERFLLNSPKICPEGYKKDRHDICREV